MKLHRWVDIKNQGMSPSRIARSTTRVARTALAIRLRAVREAAGLTQAELGKRATISQSQLSRLESSGNVQLSTLARYVCAAGGRLEMSAILNGKRLIILSEKGKGSARGKRSQRAPTTKLGVLTASK